MLTYFSRQRRGLSAKSMDALAFPAEHISEAILELKLASL